MRVRRQQRRVPVGSPVTATIVQIALVSFDSCQHVGTAKYYGPGSSVQPLPMRFHEPI